MSASPEPASNLTAQDPKPHHPSLGELFRAFIGISLSGFGGALPWARRMVVERRRWMTAEEFNETFTLSQFLPGPNTVNFAVVFGTRFGAAVGAALAVIGVIGPPLVVVTGLAYLYERYGGIAILSHVLGGIAAAAAGLMVAMVVKMAKPLVIVRRWSSAPVVAIVAFIGVAIMHWPLPYVFLGLAPVSVALAWWRV